MISQAQKISLALGAAVLLVVGGVVYWQTQPKNTGEVSLQTDSQVMGSADEQPNKEEGKATTYTMADVLEHNNADSCWSVVEGGVYDLTAWIGMHPGGEQAILGLCGADGTAAFKGQHGDAQQQNQALATMKIGVLVE